MMLKAEWKCGELYFADAEFSIGGNVRLQVMPPK